MPPLSPTRDSLICVTRRGVDESKCTPSHVVGCASIDQRFANKLFLARHQRRTSTSLTCSPLSEGVESLEVPGLCSGAVSGGADGCARDSTGGGGGGDGDAGLCAEPVRSTRADGAENVEFVRRVSATSLSLVTSLVLTPSEGGPPPPVRRPPAASRVCWARASSWRAPRRTWGRCHSVRATLSPRTARTCTRPRPVSRDPRTAPR